MVTATQVSATAQFVSFSASGLPTGATASFAPGSCSPTCSSTVTLTTSASTPTGTSTITVTGVAGSLSHTTTFKIRREDAWTPFTVSPLKPSCTCGNQRQALSNTITATLVSGT